MSQRPEISQAIRTLFNGVRQPAAEAAVRDGITLHPHPLYEQSLGETEREVFSVHFDLQMADQILNAERRINPEGLFEVSTILNSMPMYAHTIERSERRQFNSLLTSMERESGHPYSSLPRGMQLDQMAHAIAGANAAFQVLALLAIGYNLALGTNTFRQLRKTKTDLMTGSDAHQSFIIDTVTNHLASMGMNQPASSAEDLYGRFIQAYTNTADSPGVISALLADDKRAFGYSAGSDEGCDGMAYAVRTFDAFGGLLATSNIREVVLPKLGPTQAPPPPRRAVAPVPNLPM